VIAVENNLGDEEWIFKFTRLRLVFKLWLYRLILLKILEFFHQVFVILHLLLFIISVLKY